MPFRSKKQMKACFASNGFHGKVDCHEWAHATPSIKSLPDKVKNFGGAIDYYRKNCLKCGGKAEMQTGGNFTPNYPSINYFKNTYYNKQDSADYKYNFERAIGNSDSALNEAAKIAAVQANYMTGKNTKDYDREFLDYMSMKYDAFHDAANQIQKQKSTDIYNNYSATPVSRRLFQRGGMMQKGGCFDAIGNQIPCEGQQLQGSSGMNWQNPQIQSPANPLLQNIDPAYTTRIQEEGERTGYDVDPIRQRNNGNWVINDNDNKVDPFQVGLGIQSATAGLSWLSGVFDRRRQNRYLRGNLSTLGSIESQPVSNFQPNPYNLYAKLGGNIKRYMYTNDSHNTAIDETAARMPSGENTTQQDMKRNPFSATSKYAGGGLSREKNYGSAKKPYPSVASSDFAGGHRSYPIPTKADAIDALRLAHLHGRQDVIAKVHAKYPELKEGGKWLQGAINPAHKGWCTPLSNPHCTGHRRAFALMMKKKHGFQ